MRTVLVAQEFLLYNYINEVHVKSSEVLGFLLFIFGYLLGRIDSIAKFFLKKSSEEFSKSCSKSTKLKKSNKIPAVLLENTTKSSKSKTK